MTKQVITSEIQSIIDRYGLKYTYTEYADTFFGEGDKVHDFLYFEQDEMYHSYFCHFSVNVHGEYFTIFDGTSARFHVDELETKLVQWLDLLGVRV